MKKPENKFLFYALIIIAAILVLSLIIGLLKFVLSNLFILLILGIVVYLLIKHYYKKFAN